jgi:hypothetical protein
MCDNVFSHMWVGAKLDGWWVKPLQRARVHQRATRASACNAQA